MKNKRRFRRVTVQATLAEVFPMLGAQISWPNHETSEILDLSYKGFAVRRPGLFPVAVQQRVLIAVELGGVPTFTLEARIAWCYLESLGLDVAGFSAEGHAAMSFYLGAKLLGSKLRPVERIFVAKGQSFQYWYQAGDTHVFVWMNAQKRIERVDVSFSGEVVALNRGDRLEQPSANERRALLLLSQMDKDSLPMEEFVRSLASVSAKAIGV